MADHAEYSERAVASDVLEVMRALGHTRSALAGHDRGGAVAPRLALDHPDTVSRVAFIDISRITARFATQCWHWFSFAQPDIPERVINAEPDSWYHGAPRSTEQEDYEEWRSATRNPDVVPAIPEDYRAGLTIDRDVRGHGIDAGHYVVEEAPEALAACLAGFFAGRPGCPVRGEFTRTQGGLPEEAAPCVHGQRERPVTTR